MIRSFLLFLAFIAAPSAHADPAKEFRRLHEAEWSFRLKAFPQLATSVGDHRYNDRLADMSLEAINRRHEYYRGLLEKLDALDSEALSPEERINFRIFRRQIQTFVTDVETGEHLIPLNSDWGFHVGLARLPANAPLANAKDYRNYLARLEQVPRVMDQYIDLMQRGIERGMVQPRVVLQGRDVSITTHIVDEVESSVFYRPFSQFPATIDEALQEEFEAAGRTLVADEIIPSYRKFLDFFNGPYMEAARESLAATTLPNGEAFYQGQIRKYTTLDLTPHEIHAIGQREVKRIRAEMETIIDNLEFEGGFDAFLEFLRTDPRFYAESPRELLAEASYISKKIDGRLPALFGHLPRQPYGVEPVPEDLAPFFTAGRYVGAAEDARRGGMYWVNTHDLPSRPLYALPALTLHEAVPGHHLQNALALELGDLPPFRRYDYISAYGEGWALYSEWLGVEAEIYETPYENFGRLTYEMWRACRLVVDTGMHAKGWSREKAVDFMASNTALSLHEVNTEIDRYISWPAQALSYKLGELKIKALRKRASEALGDRFDLRAFHDRILSLGSVPLDVLEGVIVEWIAAQQG
ncbi:MAG: DUF885 domain-containing protein [Xanthomonadales bacterium]|nr:DUF885 domain-containing protein [Xanthomonadales bacterium]